MGKNIIICFDGTGNKFGKNNTNIVHTMELILKTNQQVACYDPGVGTVDLFGKARRNSISITLGKAFGYGINFNVLDGYKFLMRQFHPDDKLFIFGFSRGAFTARTLAGMLHKCGLIEDRCYNLLPAVSDLYFQQKNNKLAAQFKSIFSRQCKPHFIGIWDSVESLGYFLGKKFPDTVLNTDISYGYHAVAIDEKRKKFQVCLWDESKKKPHQTIEQVWFPGVHADIGGWYDERGLSDITLIWLLEKAKQCGLLLKPNWKDELKPDPLALMHESRKGLWKLWPVYSRKIPEKALIHKSVIERIKQKQDYHPSLPKAYTIVD